MNRKLEAFVHLFLIIILRATCQEENRLRSSSNFTIEKRIVGGNDASRGEYPWLVALYKTVDPTGYFPICQGSLIAPQVVLTAAHCIDTVKSAEIGNHDYLNDSKNRIQRFTFSKKIKHPYHEYHNFDYDYGLLLLDRPHPNPTLVSIRASPEIPARLRIMGWGQTTYNGAQPSVLKEASIKRLPDSSCQELYDVANLALTNRMFCAAATGIDACQGDSGGPIVREGTNIQVGIVSWGIECANPKFPGVYAKIYFAYRWINRVACSWTTTCTRGQIDMVNESGEVLKRANSCQDMPNDFAGLGKKGKRRNCRWVSGRLYPRCQWYGDLYCPATCNIERCRLKK